MILSHSAAGLPSAGLTIFDVEGILVDCIPQTLVCWNETLRELGPSARHGKRRGRRKVASAFGVTIAQVQLPKEIRLALKLGHGSGHGGFSWSR